LNEIGAMIFPQEKRFCEGENVDQLTGSNFFSPRSELSNKGTKIVDSWAIIDSPRFDPKLVVRDDFLLHNTNTSEEIFAPLNLPNLEFVKPKSTACKFSKSVRKMSLVLNDNPGAKYSISNNTNNIPGGNILLF